MEQEGTVEGSGAAAVLIGRLIDLAEKIDDIVRRRDPAFAAQGCVSGIPEFMEDPRSEQYGFSRAGKPFSLSADGIADTAFHHGNRFILAPVHMHGWSGIGCHFIFHLNDLTAILIGGDPEEAELLTIDTGDS